MSKSSFSSAITPGTEGTAQVLELKDQLAEAIGNFGSRKSAAHLTINTFSGDFPSVNLWRKYAGDFCAHEASAMITFERISSYPNGTLFLEPDEQSRKYLMRLMDKFNLNSAFTNKSKCKDPHLTIARNLTKDQTSAGLRLFKQKPLRISFLCETISLRRLEESQRQYVVEASYNLANTEGEQAGMF